MSSFHVVMHIFTLNHWKENVLNKLERIRRSNLADVAKMHFSVNYLQKEHISESIELINGHFNKYEIIFDGSNRFEHNGIYKVWELSQCEDCNILYLHTKGVTKPNSRPVAAWDEVMTYFCIDKWRDCVDKLKEYNTAGPRYADRGSKHFSGNFWWARSDYIKTLQKPFYFPTRFDYEMWIGTGDIKAYNMHDCCHVDQYAHYYGPENYVDKD